MTRLPGLTKEKCKLSSEMCPDLQVPWRHLFTSRFKHFFFISGEKKLNSLMHLAHFVLTLKEIRHVFEGCEVRLGEGAGGWGGDVVQSALCFEWIRNER